MLLRLPSYPTRDFGLMISLDFTAGEMHQENEYANNMNARPYLLFSCDKDKVAVQNSHRLTWS